MNKLQSLVFNVYFGLTVVFTGTLLSNGDEIEDFFYGITVTDEHYELVESLVAGDLVQVTDTKSGKIRTYLVAENSHSLVKYARYDSFSDSYRSSTGIDHHRFAELVSDPTRKVKKVPSTLNASKLARLKNFSIP